MKTLSSKDFSEIYQKYAPLVLRRCRAILKNEEEALEAMQDVFLKIFDTKYKKNELSASLFFETASQICASKNEHLYSAMEMD